MADEEHDDEEDEGEGGAGVALLAHAQPAALAPDLAQPPPDQGVQDAQGDHGREHGDEEGAHHVVAQEVADRVKGGRGLDAPADGRLQSEVVVPRTGVVDFL